MEFLDVAPEGLPDDLPGLRERSDFTGSGCLPENIADRGGFHRTRNHRPVAGVGGELVQKPVAAASADDVHHFDPPSRDDLKRAQDLPVPQRKTLERTARELSLRLGNGLL
jgi:hypothetical protein